LHDASSWRVERVAGHSSSHHAASDTAAKEETRAILDVFGWETEDVGAMEAARAIEPLCILWCIPGLLKNDWVHAFKVLR
jgi:hypothetical protein